MLYMCNCCLISLQNNDNFEVFKMGCTSGLHTSPTKIWAHENKLNLMSLLICTFLMIFVILTNSLITTIKIVTTTGIMLVFLMVEIIQI